MAGELRVHRRPELTRPVVIAAFRGWNDGAQAASLAAGYLAKTWQAERFAEVDPESFFDFQANRLARDRLLPRAPEWPRARRRAAARDRAEPSLAHLHRAGRRARSRPRRGARDHARCA